MRLPICWLLGLVWILGTGVAADPAGAVQVRSGFVEVDGGRLFYEVAGEGLAAVLIHDGLLHRETWDEQFPALADGFKLIRYDRRGYGRSSRPERPFSNLADLERLFQELKIGKACLIGSSAGGGLAVDFALRHPEQVTGLILVGAVVSGLGFTEHFQTRGGRFGPADMSDAAALRKYFISDPYSVSPANPAARERVKALMEANPQNLDPAHRRLHRDEARSSLRQLSELRVPALILVGEDDIPDVHAHAGAINAGIAGSERVVIPQAGHLLPLEQPVRFNELAIRFLRGADFWRIFYSQGPKAAAEVFERLLAARPGEPPATEAHLNREGYRYLLAGRVTEAVALFQLCVLAYPDSANAPDSLGEAFLMQGKYDDARKNYQRSLDLNPGNANARQMLARIDEAAAVRPEVRQAAAEAAADWVLVPGGTCRMGNTTVTDEAIKATMDNPPREVTLKPFYLMSREVTNAQYLEFCLATGHHLPEFWGMARHRSGPDYPDHPVIGVSWEDARDYVKWRGWRLPTEAEWESAARGGLTEKKFPNGDEVSPAVANTAPDGIGTKPVGSYPANGYGLFDMAGNVAEWVSDSYDRDYYRTGPAQDSPGPEKGKFRVIRGGGWHSGPSCCRVFYRNARSANLVDFNLGFRCAKDAPPGMAGAPAR